MRRKLLTNEPTKPRTGTRRAGVWKTHAIAAHLHKKEVGRRRWGDEGEPVSEEGVLRVIAAHVSDHARMNTTMPRMSEIRRKPTTALAICPPTKLHAPLKGT